MIDAIKGRARLIRAGILSASVLAFIPILGLVRADTSTGSNTNAAAVAPPAPTPAQVASSNNYRSYGREGNEAPRYGREPGQQSTAPTVPAPSTQSPAPAPHTRSRGS